MLLKCKENVYAWNDVDKDIFFTKGNTYEFIPVDNRWTRVTMKEYNFIGYVKKDDDKFKRWMSKEFKEQYFEEGK